MLQALQIASLKADADLYAVDGTALVKKIEAGRFAPMNAQRINQPERPFIGVKVMGYTPHLGKVEGYASGTSVHDVTTRADIQHADGQADLLEAKLQLIISHLAFTVGSKRVSNPYGFNTGFADACLITPGAGNVTMISAPSNGSTLWTGEAEYVWTTRVRLAINH